MARLPFSTLLLVGTFAWATGCVITIPDDEGADTGDDEAEDTTSADEGETGSSSETTADGDADADTTDADAESSETGDGDTTDTDGDTTETGDGDTETTGDGDGDCAPMNAMNGPEECFNPRGWFWNGEACEQIICTCDGDDCNALYPNEGACLEQYGECPAPPPPDCAPQEANGVGLCDLFLGWKWDGVDCVPLSGCNCDGPDCGNLYDDPDQCKNDHPDCGFGDECEPDDAVPFGDCDLFLGVVWTGDVCVGISGCECEGVDCDNLPLDEETCWNEHALCELNDPCEADDAYGDGLCDQFFGYAWNGEACVGISGCECTGLDCQWLPWDLEVCEAEHADCGGGGVPPCPGITDAKGVGLCQLFFGYAWNGMTCEGISGCDCQGLDCGNLYPDFDICQMETEGCL